MPRRLWIVCWLLVSMLPVAVRGAEPLVEPGRMLDLADTGTDLERIDFANLPVLSGEHAVIRSGSSVCTIN
jgi:hypothetical protein